jgi:uncharacterized protein (TIGR00297 family)
LVGGCDHANPFDRCPAVNDVLAKGRIMPNLPASLLQLLLGGIFAGGIALAAWLLRWLTGSGALAAFGLGWIVFGLGGLSWAVVLLAFFVTSTILSKLFKKKKQSAETFYEKSSRRDAGQVLANGFVAGLFVVSHYFFPDSLIPWCGFAAALAAANADTWATELGILNKRSPILITTGKTVEKGTSGAISYIGTLAACLGSALIAVVAWFVWNADFVPNSLVWITMITLSGVFGSLVDSYLGALAQTIYFCPVCKKETEQHPNHACGAVTIFQRGWRWLDNDWVNFFCTSSAALLTLLASFLLFD